MLGPEGDTGKTCRAALPHSPRVDSRFAAMSKTFAHTSVMCWRKGIREALGAAQQLGECGNDYWADVIA